MMQAGGIFRRCLPFSCLIKSDPSKSERRGLELLNVESDILSQPANQRRSVCIRSQVICPISPSSISLVHRSICLPIQFYRTDPNPRLLNNQFYTRPHTTFTTCLSIRCFNNNHRPRHHHDNHFSTAPTLHRPLKRPS